MFSALSLLWTTAVKTNSILIISVRNWSRRCHLNLLSWPTIRTAIVDGKNEYLPPVLFFWFFAGLKQFSHKYLKDQFFMSFWTIYVASSSNFRHRDMSHISTYLAQHANHNKSGQLRVQYPFDVNVRPNHQVLEQAETATIAPFPGYNLSGSTARCHANHNKSRKFRALTHRHRKAAPRLHACAIAHASFFLPSPRAQCSLYHVIWNIFR